MSSAELTDSAQVMATPEPPLTGRVVRGAAWVFAGNVAGRGLQFVNLVILARLLTPEDFGLFGIVMLALATLETFSETGFGTALIQRKGDIREYLDTAWTVQVIRGFVLAGVLYLVAPSVGWFFNESRVVLPLRVMAVSQVVRGFGNIGIIYFQKELQFHKQVAYNLLGSLASVAVGIPLAFYLRSVWALVWASVAGAGVACVLSYVLHPYRPRPCVDWTRATDLFRFGRWVFGSSVVAFLASHIDHALVGKLLGAGALGLYQVAVRISNLPTTEVTDVARAVMMPVYAKLQDDAQRLRQGFLTVLELVLSLALPLTVFIAAAAPDIVFGLLGDRWAAAVAPLRLLAIAGLIRAVATTEGPLLVGAGRPALAFWMSLSRLCVLSASAYLLTAMWGVAGTSLSVVLGLAATMPVWVKGLAVARTTWRQALRTAVPGAFLAILVAAGVCFGRNAQAGSPRAALLAETALAGCLWSGGAWLLSRLKRRGPAADAWRLLANLHTARTGD